MLGPAKLRRLDAASPYGQNRQRCGASRQADDRSDLDDGDSSRHDEPRNNGGACERFGSRQHAASLLTPRGRKALCSSIRH